MLSIVSRKTADWTAIYFWLYGNNWHLSFIDTAGFWSVLAESAWGDGIRSMPDTFLIDRQGRPAATYAGMVDRDNIEKKHSGHAGGAVAIDWCLAVVGSHVYRIRPREVEP